MTDRKIILLDDHRTSKEEEEHARRVFAAGKYIQKGLMILTGKEIQLGAIGGEIPDDGSVGELTLQVKLTPVDSESITQKEDEGMRNIARSFWCSVCGSKIIVDDPEIVNKTSITRHCKVCCRPDSEVRFFQGGKVR